MLSETKQHRKEEAASVDVSRLGATAESGKQLSVDVEAAATNLNVPLTCVEGIWKKANELIRNPDAIVPAPGQTPESRMVLSYSGKVPHLVTPTKGGGFSCDGNCPNWKSLGFCSHSIAVAELNEKLDVFITYLHKKNKSPNVTTLITSQMPSDRGRKGNSASRTRKAVQSPDSRLSMTIGGNRVEGGVNFSPVTISLSPPNYYYPWSSPYDPSVYSSVINPTPVVQHPFTLCFIRGNISVCIGCQNWYPKTKQPPDNLCIKHQEWRQFTPHGTDITQNKFSNVYYHCKPQCVWLRCPDFIPEQLDITEVQDHLQDLHKTYLLSVFNIFVSYRTELASYIAGVSDGELLYP